MLPTDRTSKLSFVALKRTIETRMFRMHSLAHFDGCFNKTISRMQAELPRLVGTRLLLKAARSKATTNGSNRALLTTFRPDRRPTSALSLLTPHYLLT